jgi:hypothetical protein
MIAPEKIRKLRSSRFNVIPVFLLSHWLYIVARRMPASNQSPYQLPVKGPIEKTTGSVSGYINVVIVDPA